MAAPFYSGAASAVTNSSVCSAFRSNRKKEVVLTIVPAYLKDIILQEIVRAAELTVPGHGLAFVVAVEAVAGIVHLVEENPF